MKSVLPFRSRAGDREWVGGRYTFPSSIREGNAVFRPQVVLWLELPSGLLIDSWLIDPRKPMSFSETLEEGMRHPAVGSPRRPTRIRVADEGLAAELRESLAGKILVVVLPVPELDEVFANLADATSEPEPSYLGEGEIAPASVAELFKTASLLFRAAPWRHVAEEQVLRVDIPRFDVDGACLSVIGGAGESSGLLLFRSLDAYVAFGNAASFEVVPRALGSIAESSLLSLSFDRKKDLRPSMLREIEQHRWPIAGAKGYPVLLSVGSDMNRLPATERDVRIMSACTKSFLAFFALHRDLFNLDDPPPVRETFTGDDDVKVTFTAPYEEESLFGRNERPSPARRVGRNEPCPCGSGKKYKRCHLEADEASSSSAASRDETVHEMDFRLVADIARFAFPRYDRDWLEPFANDIDHDEALVSLYFPWAAWNAVIDGRRVVDLYLEQNERRLSTDDLDWFAAQRRSWLSVWEVTRVEAGVIDVRDLLTGERRSVREELGSQSLVARDSLLTRVIDFRGVSVFGGMHGRVLPPFDADEVVHMVRAKLRMQKGNVAIERLQDPTVGHFMIDRWRAALVEHDERVSKPPVLQNTDGDPLLFVTESFRFDADSLGEIQRRLGTMDGINSIQSGAKKSEFVYVRDSDETVVGRVIVTRDKLRIETNSEKRADALAQRVRDACAGMLRDGKRTKKKPPSMRAAKAGTAKPAPPEISEHEQAMLRELKERHYRDWLEASIPALSGKTPREAARSAKSREQLDVLLRDIENRESRFPVAMRFDVRRLRDELGLDG